MRTVAVCSLKGGVGKTTLAVSLAWASAAGPILPVYTMVDRRRSLHRAALAANPKWPAIPMASAFEAMSAPGGGVDRLPPSSPAAMALFALWTGVEKRLAKPAKAG